MSAVWTARQGRAAASGSFLQADDGARHTDKTRQGFDTREPGSYIGVVFERDIAFGRMGDVAVGRDVGNGRFGANQIRRSRQFLIDLFEPDVRSAEHTSELQSRENLVCRLLPA